jgi:hypothetical protein
MSIATCNLHQTDLQTAWHPECIAANFHAYRILGLEGNISKIALHKFVFLFQKEIEKLLKMRTVINCPSTV